MRKRKLIIFATVLLLAIGFAAVTTTLFINGNLTIGTNNQDFNQNVIFIKADTDENSSAVISDDGKTITFVTRDLMSLGEEVSLDFRVKNNSRQYDADAVINCDYTEKNGVYNEYANITVSPSKFELLAQEYKDGNLTIRLIRSFVGTDEESSVQIGFSCTIDATAMERESLAEGVIEPSNVDALGYIMDLASGNSLELLYDGTEDNNLRYVGDSPNNYVLFNGESWRIIGVMNNIRDEDGNKGSYLKIIRDDAIGAYAFDIRYSGSSGTYYNDWTNSTLMFTLNEGAYFNRTSGQCGANTYPDTSYAVDCDFSNIGLTDNARNMIRKVVWNLGSLIGGTSPSTSTIRSDFYRAERSDNVIANHATEWLGYVGLMYASDLGYSSYFLNEEECSSYSITQMNVNTCNEANWLAKEDKQWTITPSNYESNQHMAAYFIGSSYAGANYDVRPVVYLKQDVKIMGGGGSENNPYILG